jgi:L-threonylcarbamoyladenylate synthase
METRVRPADEAALQEAAELLRAGELVAFPTETVYGLGGDATNDRAVAGIFAAKGRPSFNPLIAHVAELAAAEREAEFTAAARTLATRFWPGPLTLVLKRRPDCRISLLASAGLDTVALRMPSHPAARRLLRLTGAPVAAPSANPSGAVSPTTAEHVRAGLGGRVELILDAGPCPVGVESTVVGFDEAGRGRLLRPGGVTVEALEAEIGPLTKSAAGPIEAPGQLASHYAPHAALRLNARDVEPGEALLAFGPKPLAAADATLNLSPSGDLTEAAANLFAMLRALDDRGPSRIAVMPVPETGLGLAINDRLRRAAAPRP